MQDKEFAAILQDEPMQPLALVPLTEEEQVCLEHVLRDCRIPACGFRPCGTGPVFQKHVLSVNKTRSSHSCPFALSILYLCSPQRNFSMSVNSAAVLRLMGKGVAGAAPAGVVRGRGATRGGRGKIRRLRHLS